MGNMVLMIIQSFNIRRQEGGKSEVLTSTRLRLMLSPLKSSQSPLQAYLTLAMSSKSRYLIISMKISKGVANSVGAMIYNRTEKAAVDSEYHKYIAACCI